MEGWRARGTQCRGASGEQGGSVPASAWGPYAGELSTLAFPPHQGTLVACVRFAVPGRAGPPAQARVQLMVRLCPSRLLGNTGTLMAPGQ